MILKIVSAALHETEAAHPSPLPSPPPPLPSPPPPPLPSPSLPFPPLPSLLLPCPARSISTSRYPFSNVWSKRSSMATSWKLGPGATPLWRSWHTSWSLERRPTLTRRSASGNPSTPCWGRRTSATGALSSAGGAYWSRYIHRQPPPTPVSFSREV